MDGEDVDVESTGALAAGRGAALTSVGLESVQPKCHTTTKMIGKILAMVFKDIALILAS